MITAAGLRWVVTVLFVLVGVFCSYRCLQRNGLRDRTGDLLHVLMCVAMVAMAWPATMSVARIPQTALFGVAAVWFLATSAAGASHGDHNGRGAAIIHAIMMAAMAWMVFVMPRAMGGMPDMPGMSMPHDPVPVDVTVVALVLAVLFASIGLAFLVRAIDAARADNPVFRTLGSGTDGLMALGMALMLLFMT